MGVKLAVGCVLALTVGCVALTAVPHHAAAHRDGQRHRASAASAYLADAPSALDGSATLAESTRPGATALIGAAARRTGATPHISPTARAAAVRRAADRHAQGEFGLEQPASATAPAGSSAQSAPATARAASVQQASAAPAESTSEAAAAPASAPSGAPSRAEREFGPE
jgi:hypothetical protein